MFTVFDGAVTCVIKRLGLALIFDHVKTIKRHLKVTHLYLLYDDFQKISKFNTHILVEHNLYKQYS